VDDKEEIKRAILRRFYDGAFKDGIDYQVGLRAYASEKGIGWELINEIYDEFNDEGFFGTCCTSMAVEPSIKALVYCENQQLVDQALVEKQNDIRKRVLEACVDIREEKLTPYADGPPGDMICERANISRQDFANNAGILVFGDYIEQQYPMDIWRITEKGRETVKDLRRKRERLKEFEKLKALEKMTRQARGHRLEDLLAEAIEDEGWEVEKRVQSKGKEHDIVIHKGSEYFLISCKWEKPAVQGKAVRDIFAGAQAMVCVAGILVSMSGFTPNCIGQALEYKTKQQIILFGPKDVGAIFSNEAKFSELLKEKIKQLKLMGNILVE
jgi:hypothetical protein